MKSDTVKVYELYVNIGWPTVIRSVGYMLRFGQETTVLYDLLCDCSLDDIVVGFQ